jgi:hypothetical protein
VTIPAEFALPAHEPLSLLASPLECPPAFGSARVERLEFSCRGDRVPCTLVVPAGEGPFALVLLQRASERDEEATVLSSLARTSAWVEAGCAVASIDLPLQGERRSPKLTELLEEAFAAAAAGTAIDETATILWSEFTRQATMELCRTLDLLAALPTIDSTRVGFAGFGLGAFAGALVCAFDVHTSAAVLAGAGAGVAPAGFAPENHVGRIAPRPLLFVNEDGPGGAGSVSRDAAEALHAAAGEPKQVAWEADASQALDTAWAFLAKSLAL